MATSCAAARPLPRGGGESRRSKQMGAFLDDCEPRKRLSGPLLESREGIVRRRLARNDGTG
ncbi:hypothetical protein [Acetobacter sp. DsW_063]|uniref:hypothetical protein n=1 Tax=Acetobacter sp. DsW_063 TaxID=1514894 RepID=UPI0011778F2C|nr:hypothetical protein [Acetobacter sp. DsW_063]